MAIVSLVLGSLFGLVSAAIGMIFLDFGFLSACGLYFASSLCLATVLIAANTIRGMIRFDTNRSQIAQGLARH